MSGFSRGRSGFYSLYRLLSVIRAHEAQLEGYKMHSSEGTWGDGRELSDTRRLLRLDYPLPSV